MDQSKFALRQDVLHLRAAGHQTFDVGLIDVDQIEHVALFQRSDLARVELGVVLFQGLTDQD